MTKVFNSHLKSSIHTIRSSRTTNIPRLSPTENWLMNELQSLLKTLDLTRGKRSFQRCFNCGVTVETRDVTADAITWPLPTLASSVYSCYLATNEARRCATRHGTTDLGSAQRKHRFVYCCVIVGTCFDVSLTQQFFHGANTPRYKKYIFYSPCVNFQALAIIFGYSSEICSDSGLCSLQCAVKRIQELRN
jgi:hypothetical protein